MNNLQDKAMLVRLHIGSWSGRTFDRPATDDLLTRAGAAGDAARVNKRLVSRESLLEISRLTDFGRATHYAHTLPWDNAGLRVLPVAVFETYRDRMDKIFDGRRAAVKAFVATYDDAIAQARSDLGSLFDAADYPPAAAIEHRMVSSYEFLPIPDGEHFLADLGKEEAAAIRQQITANTEARIQGAVTDIYRRLAEAVAALARQVAPAEADQRAKRVTDSVLSNLREIVRVGPSLNLTDDPALATILRDIDMAIAGVDTRMLRPASKEYADGVRSNLSADLAGISDRLSGYLGTPETES